MILYLQKISEGGIMTYKLASTQTLPTLGNLVVLPTDIATVLNIRTNVLWPGQPHKVMYSGDYDGSANAIHLAAYLTCRNDVPLGCVSILRTRGWWDTDTHSPSCVSQVRGFSVIPPWQEKGVIGPLLLDKLEEYVRQSEFPRRLFAEVRCTNKNVLHLWLRKKWKFDHCIGDAYHSRDDRPNQLYVWMSKVLEETST